MRYLHLFETQQEHDTARSWVSGKYKEPWVALIEENDRVTYNKTWEEKYLTFEALEPCTFSFMQEINYSLDDGETWTVLPSGTSTPVVAASNRVCFKAELQPIGKEGAIGTFSSTGDFNAMGNPLSLVYGDNFVGVYDISGFEEPLLAYLFVDNTHLVSAENLALVATTLFEFSYNAMFQNCTSLTTAPELPATTLTQGCYERMFNGCTSLTTTPELPATTLAPGCYEQMFQECTSLTTAPELPATTLAQGCYTAMFIGCTSLTTTPELPATTLALGCYEQMFNGCTSLTTATNLPATQLSDWCYGYMFRDCTALTNAPELPATILNSNCYYWMFNGCSSLNYIKMMATSISANQCLDRWVVDVAASGTFVKNAAMTTLPSGTSGIPDGWTVQDATS